MGLLTGIQFLSIVGPQGSGKSTVGRQLAGRWLVPHVEASDVVRQEVGRSIARADMPKTNERTKTEPTWLGDAIAREVLGRSDTDMVVLTGVREREVFDTLRAFGGSVIVIALTCPFEERLARQLACSKCTTVEEFMQHDMNELGIGLQNVLDLAHHIVLSDEDTTPEQLVATIIDLLDNGSE